MIKQNWNAKQILASKIQFEGFLTARGAEVFAPTNEYELIRFRSGNVTSIVYTTKHGNITFFGESKTAWLAFKNSTPWRAETPLKKRGSTPAIATLRKRDGDLCFYCLQVVEQKDESEEHLLSITHGGNNHIANKVLTHRLCNTMAGHLSLAEKIRIHVKSHLKKAGK
jgi:hypothetical protein